MSERSTLLLNQKSLGRTQTATDTGNEDAIIKYVAGVMLIFLQALHRIRNCVFRMIAFAVVYYRNLV
jgi:hypothetical protein